MKYKPLTISRLYLLSKGHFIKHSDYQKAVEEGELTIIRAVYQLEKDKVIRLE